MQKIEDGIPPLIVQTIITMHTITGTVIMAIIHGPIVMAMDIQIGTIIMAITMAILAGIIIMAITMVILAGIIIMAIMVRTMAIP